LRNIKESEEIFKEMKDLVEETYSIHAKNFSNENIRENGNIEIFSGVQSEKNYRVLVTPKMVQSSAPSSPQEIEWVSSVSYFHSLILDLRDLDYEWDYKDIERIENDDDKTVNENKFKKNIFL
jgi:hypothetical protein